MKALRLIIAISVILLLFVFLVTLPGRKNEQDYGATVESTTPESGEETTTTEEPVASHDTFEQFTLPGETPMATTEPLPESETPAVSDTQAAPETTPEATTTVLEGDFMIDDGGGEWALYLVNNDNPVPEDFTVETKTVYTSYMDFKMDVKMADYMIQMIADAEADGVSLMICSAYRSVEKQTSNFNAQVAQYEAQGMSYEDAYNKTAQSIAIPGYSEHHTGLCADIVTPTYTYVDEGFEDTAAFRWLDENAWKYGFILRYPKGKEDITEIVYEPWHYRYVGTYHAKLIKESGLCLEEYITGMGE